MTLKMMLCLLAMTRLAASAPAIDSSHSEVIRYDIDTDHMPNYYQFSYDTSDGSSRSEQGQIQDPGTPNAALDVFGTTRWVTDDGAVYEMTYKAGKRGYRTSIKKIS